MNPLLFLQLLSLNIYAVNVNWSSILDPIGDMFTKENGIIGWLGGENNMMLVGAVVFVFFFALTLIFGLGMLVGSVVLIPSLFVVFQYIPPLRIIVAIIIGLVFGLGLNRLIRR